MNANGRVTCLGVLISSFVAIHLNADSNSEFVAQPRGRRGQEAKRLHQDVCMAHGDLMKAFPDLLRGIADVQALGAECIDDAIQGEKGTLAGMSKDELAQVRQRLVSCHQDVVNLSKKLKGVARIRS